jgi:hypothetical protein
MVLLRSNRNWIRSVRIDLIFKWKPSLANQANKAYAGLVLQTSKIKFKSWRKRLKIRHQNVMLSVVLMTLDRK